jgi:uncharacterized repeat protein (TIGR01451 family)
LSQVPPRGQPKSHKLTKGNHLVAQASQRITFIENKGQFDERVKFQVANARRTLWLTQSGIVFDFQQCGMSSTTMHSVPSVPISSDQAQVAKLEQKKSTGCGMERHVINQDFLGSNQKLSIETRAVQSGVRNYLSGSDPAKWQTQVRGFSDVVYHDVWPDIDLRLYGKGPDLEQEFIVNPGADASQVQLAYRGVDRLKVGNDGSLTVRAAAGQMRETSPRIYQEISGRRVPVKGRFKLLSSTSYTFELGAYDKRQPLVIDPTLLYSTFIGGSAGNNIFTTGIRESATGIAVDHSGNAYVTGFTQSPDFPTTPGAFQTSDPGGQQTFITKLNPTGSALVYSTYLNASFPTSIAVDATGNAYVSGSNIHAGFPVTANAYSPVCDATAGGASFLTVLNPSGNGLVYSTCIGTFVPNVGGVPVFTAMTADATGHVFITGTGGFIPTTPNAYQPVYPGSLGSAFVMEFDITLSGTDSLMYSTYLGIPGNPDGAHPGTQASAVAVDSFGKIYLTGFTADGFPVTPGAFQTVHATCVRNGISCPASSNAYIAKLDPTVSGQESLIYGTYFGGVGTTVTRAIAVDSAGAVYLTGSTDVSRFGSFPITPGAFQPSAGLPTGASFVTKLDSGGSQLVYSTFVSDLRASVGNAIAVDSLGNAYIAGQVNGNTFPVTPDAFQSTYSGPTTDFGDAFLSKLNATGTALIYSSYLGGTGDESATGLAIDQSGDAYVVGQTSSGNCPTTLGTFQAGLDGTGDAFVSKFPLGSSYRVLQALPSSGGNSGNLTVTISGSGFHNGIFVKLTGIGPDVPASPVVVGPNGLFLEATFNLLGADVGPRDIVVTNSDGTVLILPQAFKVLSGGAPNIQISKTATVAVPGRQLTYAIIVTNMGNLDSGTLPIVEVLEPWFTFVSSTPEPTSIRQGPDAFPPSAVGSNYNAFLQWDLPNLAAGSSRSLAYTARLDPGFLPGKPLSGPACVEVVNDACDASFAACVITVGGICIAQPETCEGIEEELHACTIEHVACEGAAGRVCGIYNQLAKSSFDPNALAGLPGVGVAQWISGLTPLSYTISFANESSATADAQKVVVTNPVDASSDLSTLQITAINLPNIQIPIAVPVLLSTIANEFATTVDLRPSQNLLVAIDVKLESISRTLTWTFTTIDPKTGKPTLDPAAGFLPPGQSGSVLFKIEPLNLLSTSTQINDQASVVFDANQPILTQVWINTIDNTPPVSQVTALPATEPASGFTLTWSGTDVGSGVQDFTIFVSDNGGQFTPFQTNTTATSATFIGEVGHTYGFYSVARDLVGNVEANKTAAEATTQVVLVSDSIPPTTFALAAPTPNAAGWNNSNVTVTLNSADDPGGTGAKQISFSATGAQPIASTTVTGATTSFQVANEGITTIAFFGTDNAGNVETPKTLTVELDKTPPSILGSRTPLPNASGWSNTDVTVSFACTDALSGLAPGSPSANTVITTEGANQSVPGACQDLAGNIASATVSGINIDKMVPTISGMPAAGCTLSATGKLVQIAMVSGADALSGLASFNVSVSSSQSGDDPNEPDIVVTGSGLQPRAVQVRAKTQKGASNRTYTINAIAIDAAGNAANTNSMCAVTNNH